MPVSRSRSKVRTRQRPASHRDRAPAPVHTSKRSSRRPRWWKRLWWGVAIFGLVLFVFGNLTARMDVAVLSFDPHHVVVQFGGAIIAVVGTLVASAR
jgi:cell division protein CrgA